MSLRPFHLAIAVNDLSAARKFYGQLLGCEEGRSSHQWVDFNFFGHQLVCHLDNKTQDNNAILSNQVDGHGVPVPHFGLVLEMESWRQTRDKLIAAKIDFVIEPNIRFQGEVGEQATMFFSDPAGNHLEIKAFAEIDQLFASA